METSRFVAVCILYFEASLIVSRSVSQTLDPNSLPLEQRPVMVSRPLMSEYVAFIFC